MKDKFESYLKIYRTWSINPKTRIKKSKKIYNRAKHKQEILKEG